MYKLFAITVAVSVAVSGRLALTLSPALCAVLLKEGHHKPARFFFWFNNAFDGLTRRYVRGVAFLNRRIPGPGRPHGSIDRTGGELGPFWRAGSFRNRSARAIRGFRVRPRPKP